MFRTSVSHGVQDEIAAETYSIKTLLAPCIMRLMLLFASRSIPHVCVAYSNVIINVIPRFMKASLMK